MPFVCCAKVLSKKASNFEVLTAYWSVSVLKPLICSYGQLSFLYHLISSLCIVFFCLEFKMIHKPWEGDSLTKPSVGVQVLIILFVVFLTRNFQPISQSKLNGSLGIWGDLMRFMYVNEGLDRYVSPSSLIQC